MAQVAFPGAYGGDAQGLQLRRAGSPLYLRIVASAGIYTGRYSDEAGVELRLGSGRRVSAGRSIL